MKATAEKYPEMSHERRDVDVVSLFTIVLLLFMSLAIIAAVVGIMIHFFNANTSATTSGSVNIPGTRLEEFPPPRLLVRPGESLSELHAAEDADLSSYGWIDRNAAIVRIPIDRAMKLLVERGLPDVGAGQTPLSLMQARPTETASPPRLMQQP